MNERIRLIAEQASKQAFPIGSIAFMEIFAEELVRECARVYWSIDDGELHTEYVDALKKHFGIKE